MRTISMLTFASAIWAAALPTQASAESNWTYIARAKAAYYIDRNSIRRSGNMVRYWVRADYTNHEYGWDYVKTFEQSDCEERKQRTLQMTIFYKDGHSTTYNSPTEWEYAIPDSVADVEQNFVCAF